jgi:hypothetical protein
MGDETSLRDDISFLRQMAESGRRGPILGGIFLVVAGIVFGLGCVVSWLGYQNYLPIQGWNQVTLWLVAFAVFWVVWLYLFLKMRSTQAIVGQGSASATFGVIWGVCGSAVIVCFAAVEIVVWKLDAPVVQAAFVPVIFVFYGTAWICNGALAKRRWMFVAGAGSFVFTLLLALLAGTTYQALGMGFGLLLLLTLPGLKLVSDEAKP